MLVCHDNVFVLMLHLHWLYLHVLYMQVQAVTSVGAGNFSSPVTVVVGQPSADSSTTETGLIVGVVIAVSSILLAVIGGLLLAFRLW